MFTATGIVLAGGQSRRMGREKALLSLEEFGKRTFVEHLTTSLSSACSEVIVVARDAVQANALTFPGIQTVSDAQPMMGPLMGLYTGLSAMHTPRAMLVAVDMPLVEVALMAFLLSQSQDEAALVPVVDAISQVLCAVYPQAILPLVTERLAAGYRDLRGLLDGISVHYVDEGRLRQIDPSLRSFVNFNTPEDLARWSGNH